MNGVHKFQVDAIKTSKIRIFSDNRIPFKVWLSSTEMRAFLICTRLVITLQLTLTSNPHLFFPYSNIWWRCWTSTCDEVGVRCSHSLLLLVSQTRWQVYQLNLTSSACIAVEPPASCLFYDLHWHWWCRRKNIYLPVITSTSNYGRIFCENPDLNTSFRCRDCKCIGWWRSW